MTSEDDAEVPLRGAGVLRFIERAFLWAENGLAKVIPAPYNPLLQAGAVANTSLLLAIISGVLLLFWYTPNVHDAYASVLAMGEAPWSGGLFRAVHRYSSDAGMAFVLWHAARLTAARRIVGARWLAWVTGIVAIGVLWGVGWLGYWLIWDQAAQQLATASAAMADLLPVFADPLSRSFLTDADMNSLLFFVVFFVHMLLPVAGGVVLWLHIARVSRARFLTGARMSAAVVGATVVLSLLFPPPVGEPAQMAVLPTAFSMDAWYLLPLAITDRLGPGAVWLGLVVGLAALLSVPWTLAAGKTKVAAVTPSRCQGCTLCSKDCPYDAIAMIPRVAEENPLARLGEGRPEDTAVDLDMRKHDLRIVASVDPSRCVGCGICAGSCDSAAIGLDWMPALSQRKQVDGWLDGAKQRGEPTWAAFVCAGSAGGEMALEEDGRCADLPGYRVTRVPCTGWIHPLSVERALRHGARGVLLVSCGPAGCRYREGADWTADRMGGAREPGFRPGKVGPDQVAVVGFDPPDRAGLVRAAAAFREGRALGPRAPRRWVSVAAGLGLAAAAGGLVLMGSELPYVVPGSGAPELVISLHHPGQTGERCRAPTQAELDALPKHMRPTQICARGRAPVRVRVTIDEQVVLDQSYAPGGLWGDEASVALERVEVSPGRHQVAVALSDADDGSWGWQDARALTFEARRREVLRFDRNHGFRWPGGE